MIICIGIVAFNEENYIQGILKDILNQTYSLNKVDLLLIDSVSNDATLSLMENFVKHYKHLFYDVKILSNPKKIQSAGWNVAIQNFKGEALIRIDAHASIPKSFVGANVNCLNAGKSVCGGMRTSVIEKPTPWKQTLLLAETSAFGSGIASYRRSNTSRYVDTLFHACYRRTVLENVGLFNETLGRTEDNEFHYRVRTTGYKIFLDMNITSSQYIRSNFTALIKQKYANGYWIGKTLYTCPKCLSKFYFVPCIFVMLILLLIAFYIFSGIDVIYYFLMFYFICSSILTLLIIINQKRLRLVTVILPLLFFSIHFSYGIGTLCGLFEGATVWFNIRK